MNEFRHPLGNFKISALKSIASFFSSISLFILGFFFKLEKNKSELIISSSFFAPWKDDKHFRNIYSDVKNYTLLDTKRLYTLWQMSNMLKNYKGDILDVGCLKGGAGMVMSKKNNLGETFLIDTFEGLIESENYHNKSHFIYKNINTVRSKIKNLRLKNTTVLKGKFPTNFDKRFKNKKFKLCHIDVNTYKSTSLSFNYLKKKIVKNGVIVFDDYGIYSVFGVKKFVDKIMNKNKDFLFLNNYMGQCILIKK